MKSGDKSSQRLPMRYRADVLYILAAITPAAGLLPLPAVIIDIGWVCALSLTASLIIICLIARNTSQLRGFTSLLASTIFLRILLTAASLKTILLATAGPSLIRLPAEKFMQTGPIAAAAALAIPLPVCLYVVFRFAPQMRRAAMDFATRILPLKRAGLAADLDLEVISRRQAQLLLEKIRAESTLFASLAVFSVLLRTEAAVSASLLPALCGLKILYASAGPQWIYQDAFVIIAHTAALSLLLFVPAAGCAWACASLASKEKISLQPQPSGRQPAEVQIISHGTGQSEQIELLNPDFAIKSTAAANIAENIVDFEPAAPDTSDACDIEQLPQDSPQAYYEALYQAIGSALAQKNAPVVLTSRTAAELPVTVVVNIAILITHLRGRCLLIGQAMRQSPLARVFDINPEDAARQPQACCIKKLDLFETDMSKLTTEKIKLSQSQFETILIYAPQAPAIAPEIIGNSHILLLTETAVPKTEMITSADPISFRRLSPLRTAGR